MHKKTFISGLPPSQYVPHQLMAQFYCHPLLLLLILQRGHQTHCQFLQYNEDDLLIVNYETYLV